VVVENRPGGDNIVGVMAFVGARDGHTLLFSLGGPITVNPLTQENLPYDPARDLLPISAGAETFVAVTAPTSLKVERLADFVAVARTQPGKLNWGAQPGPLDYVVPGFLHHAGLEMVHVSYRELGPVLQDLSESRIHLYAASLATLTPLFQAGKAKALAVTNRGRSPSAPDIPTASEAGFPVLEMDPFLGFFGPRDMSLELREKIATDIRAAGADPAMTARLASTGQVVRTSTPTEFAAVIEEQRARMAAIAKVIGNRPRQ
jgi:tripartite-type tricarboxylate transporter receptor subunit TctC